MICISSKKKKKNDWERNLKTYLFRQSGNYLTKTYCLHKLEKYLMISITSTNGKISE